jgi:hypothetical protein
MGGIDWIDLAQDRDKWRALLKAVLNFRIPCNAGYFFGWLRTDLLLKKDTASWSK